MDGGPRNRQSLKRAARHPGPGSERLDDSTSAAHDQSVIRFAPETLTTAARLYQAGYTHREQIGNSYEPTGSSTAVKQPHFSPRDPKVLRCTWPYWPARRASMACRCRARDRHGPAMTDMSVGVDVVALYKVQRTTPSSIRLPGTTLQARLDPRHGKNPPSAKRQPCPLFQPLH